MTPEQRDLLIQAEESGKQIQHAEEFLEVARRQIGRVEDHES